MKKLEKSTKKGLFQIVALILFFPIAFEGLNSIREGDHSIENFFLCALPCVAFLVIDYYFGSDD